MVTLLIPGAIGTTPWFIGLMWVYQPFRDLIARNHTETALCLLLVMLLVGIVIEDLGIHIESWFDQFAERSSNGEHMRNWYDYLRTAYVADPVGRRYIRTVVLRLKFEFGVSLATTLAAVGILWLIWLGVSCRLLLPFLAISVVFAGFELFEAYTTHKLLAATRKEMLKEIKIVSDKKLANDKQTTRAPGAIEDTTPA